MEARIQSEVVADAKARGLSRDAVDGSRLRVLTAAYGSRLCSSRAAMGAPGGERRGRRRGRLLGWVLGRNPIGRRPREWKRRRAGSASERRSTRTR